MDDARQPREGAANWVWAAMQPKLAVFTTLLSHPHCAIHRLIGTAPQGIAVSDR